MPSSSVYRTERSGEGFLLPAGKERKITMKNWKQLATGLLSLMLAASLTGGALAAGPKTIEAAGEPVKTETSIPKPAGPFSRWFSDMGVDPEDPKASEAVLASMGTVINQTKTAGNETLTLNGAVWDGSNVQLSFTAKSPHFPKELNENSWLSSAKCTAKMSEEQWKEYVNNRIESESADLSEEERDQWFQYLMRLGQIELSPRMLSVNSREENTAIIRTSIPLGAFLEKQELTLRIEDVTIQGQSVLSPEGEQADSGVGSSVLKGPFEFTFTLDKLLPPMNYKGNIKTTIGTIPARITSARVSPTGVIVDYALDVKSSANVIHRGEKSVAGKINIDMDKDLSARVEGVWMKNGRYMDCSSSFAVDGVMTSADGKTVTGRWNRKYPYVVDPAAVTAVKIGGVRMELSGLEPK